MERLSDGTQITVRPIDPSDRDALAAALEHLSEASVRARFLAPKDHFSERELDYLTRVDGHDHVALVAEPVDAPGCFIGVGRFVRLPDDPQTAEVAITIADEHQGKGLGRLLGARLAEVAGEHGIAQFTATMLADNIASHRLFASMTNRLPTQHHGSVDELLVPLAA